MALKNYQIFINGQPVKEVKNLETPIEKNRKTRTHYFRKQNWKKSRR